MTDPKDAPFDLLVTVPSANELSCAGHGYELLLRPRTARRYSPHRPSAPHTPSPRPNPSTNPMPLSKSRPASRPSWPEPSHGFVPPSLTRQLLRFAFEDHPDYAASVPPRFSLECEQLFRTMPLEFWIRKAAEHQNLSDECDAIDKQLRAGKGDRDELLEVRRDMSKRVSELATGYVVLMNARYAFMMYLHERGVLSEYWWQAIEEYAEGAAGGLSLYWPESARQRCSEGAMVRADWVVQRFANERDDTGQVPPPQLAFLHSPPPEFRSRPPHPIVTIPPRHPSSKLTSAPGLDVPPPYTPSRQHDSTATTSGSPFSARHSSDSGHGYFVDTADPADLIDLDDKSSYPSQRPQPNL